VLGVGLVFGRTVWFGFTGYDDPLYVTENPWVLGGLTPAGAAWALTTDRGSSWVPLTWLSLLLDAQLYGNRAGGYHLTNVVLHAACAAGLFLLLRGATGRTWPAAVAAAMFALHPLRVEAVAWVTARKDVLSGLFFMLTLWAYGWYVQRPSLARYAAVAAALALGLMAKSMLVTTPVLLLLLDYWPLERIREPGDLPRLACEKLPLLAVSLAAAAITVAVQGETLVHEPHMTLAWRAAQATLAYVGYLGMFLWPANLAVLYPRSGTTLPWPAVAVAAALLAGITLVAWRERRRFPFLIVGWLWYLVAFLPTIGLVQVGVVAMADRFTYIPLIGPVVALVWLAADLLGADNRAGRSRSGAGALAAPSPGAATLGRAVAGVAAGGIVAGLAVASYVQTAAWSDSETLWRSALAHSRNNAHAHLALGVALGQSGRLEESIAEIQKALEFEPDSGKCHRELGFALWSSRRFADAAATYRRAIALDPSSDKAANDLAWLLATCPDPAIRSGDEAVTAATTADRLTGGTEPTVLDTLAAAHAEAGRFAEAIDIARRALELAERRGDARIAAELRSHLALFAAGKPVRDPVESPR